MSNNSTTDNTIEGVVIGIVTALGPAGEPMVAYSGNRSELPVAAKSTISVDSNSIGREVALLFEGGDITRPLILGLIQNEMLEAQAESGQLDDSPATQREAVTSWLPEADTHESELKIDGERVELKAKKEIVLKCGKSSITLTRAGKVIIRGAYISTRSSGANRIKGGSVQIN